MRKTLETHELQEREVEEEKEEMKLIIARPAVEKNIEECPMKRKLSSFQSQRLKKLNTSSAIEEDIDRKFLLSMLSDYKAMAYAQKLHFKLIALLFSKNVRTGLQPAQAQATSMTPPFNFQFINKNLHQYCTPQSSGQYQIYLV